MRRQSNQIQESSCDKVVLYILKSGELLSSGYFYPENTSVVGLGFRTSLKTQLAGPDHRAWLPHLFHHLRFSQYTYG